MAADQLVEHAQLEAEHAQAQHNATNARLTELQLGADQAAQAALAADAQARQLWEEGALEAATAQGVLAVQMHSKARGLHQDAAGLAITAEAQAAERAGADSAVRDVVAAKEAADARSELLLNIASARRAVRLVAAQQCAALQELHKLLTTAEASDADATAASAQAAMLDERLKRLGSESDADVEGDLARVELQELHDRSAASETNASAARGKAAELQAAVSMCDMEFGKHCQRLEALLRAEQAHEACSAATHQSASTKVDLERIKAAHDQLQEAAQQHAAERDDAKARTEVALQDCSQFRSAARAEDADKASVAAAQWQSRADAAAAAADHSLQQLQDHAHTHSQVAEALEELQHLEACALELSAEIASIAKTFSTKAGPAGAKSVSQADDSCQNSFALQTPVHCSVLAALTAQHHRMADARDAQRTLACSQAELSAAESTWHGLHEREQQARLAHSTALKAAAQLKVSGPENEATAALDTATSAERTWQDALEQCSRADETVQRLRRAVADAVQRVEAANVQNSSVQALVTAMRQHDDTVLQLQQIRIRLGQQCTRMDQVKARAKVAEAVTGQLGAEAEKLQSALGSAKTKAADASAEQERFADLPAQARRVRACATSAFRTWLQQLRIPPCHTRVLSAACMMGSSCC
jgi:hypothetical protein